MKSQTFQKLPQMFVLLTTLSLAAGRAVAQDSSTSTTANTAPPAAATPALPQLSYGVSEILQLEQAKVGDSTIIAYVQNSGNNYGLNAAQIIYLRQQGVSSAVINAMLNQRSQTTQTTLATPSSPAPAPTQNYADQSSAQTTVASQPSASYVPATSSTVYVVPDTQTYYYNNWLYNQNPYYYGYYPYYGYYWPYPAVSVSFGWGGGWGGYHSGWHGGGGWHGSGGWHGGGGWHH